jgi:hypothetical protein
MENFGQLVQGWQTFYATIATSAATLVGLLFVALSLKLEDVNFTKNAEMRVLARQTFTTFLYLIAISLTFLIPGQDQFGLGPSLLAIALLGLILTVTELRAVHPDLTQAKNRTLLRRSLIKIAAFASLLVIGILTLRGASAAILYWMITPILFLLFSASLNTWSLLIGVQKTSKRG